MLRLLSTLRSACARAQAEAEAEASIGRHHRRQVVLLQRGEQRREVAADTVVSQGSVEFEAPPLPEKPASSAPTGTTAGRTVFEADTSVFLCWLSQHGFQHPGAPDGTVPWPLFISLGAGLYWRTVGPSDDPPLVNRAMEWSLRRALRSGETINGVVWPADYRASRSHADWVVRQGRCSFHVDSDDGGDHELASYSATSMFQRV